METYNLQLTALLELALQDTQAVQRGFIESIIAAGSPDATDEQEIRKRSPSSADKNIDSPVTVLEFSFNDLF